MNCWHCNTELIWESDTDAENSEMYSMITFLNCPSCKSSVEIYKPKENE